MNRLLSILLVPLVTAACGDSTSVPGADAHRILLSVVSGDAQTDTVTRALDQPIEALAIDTSTARAAPGIILNWVRVVGTDTTYIGAGITNDSGIGRLQPALATKAGDQTFVAWALDNEGHRTVYAAATAWALPGPAVNVTVVPDSLWVRFDSLQTDTVAIELRIVDAYSNAAEPCAIQWTSADSARVRPLGLVAQRNDKPYALFQINFSIGGGAVLLSATAACGGTDSFKLMYSWN